MVCLTNAESWELWKALGSPKYIMAPMFNGSDHCFRRLSLRYGTDVAFTPMINCKTFQKNAYYREEVLHDLGVYDNREKFVIAQLAGSELHNLLFTCEVLQDYVDVFDLNCGCPQAIAFRGKYGSAMLKDTKKSLTVIEQLVKLVKKPISIKLRIVEDEALLNNLPKKLLNDSEHTNQTLISEISGNDIAYVNRFRFDELSKVYEKTIAFCRSLETLGICFLTIHARSSKNKSNALYAADWDLIAYLVSVLNIPVVANGSVCSKTTADECLEFTKAAAVMSAESLLYDPTLFYENTRPSKKDLILELLEMYKHTKKYSLGTLRNHMFRLMFNYFELNPAERKVLQQLNDFDAIYKWVANIDCLDSSRDTNCYHAYFRHNLAKKT